MFDNKLGFNNHIDKMSNKATIFLCLSLDPTQVF